MIEELNKHVRISPIKYNLKLDEIYNIPNVVEPLKNRAFKEIFADSDIGAMVDIDFSIFLSEEDTYMNKGSGFTLSCIDGLLRGRRSNT